LTSWETEKAIWDTILFDENKVPQLLDSEPISLDTERRLIQIEPGDTSLLVTEPVLDLPILQASYDQIVFEEYEFHSYCRTTGTLSSSPLVPRSLRTRLRFGEETNCSAWTGSMAPRNQRPEEYGRMYPRSRLWIQFHSCHSRCKRQGLMVSHKTVPLNTPS
jgi:Actin